MAKMQAGSIAQLVHFASRLRPEAVASPAQTADHPGRSGQIDGVAGCRRSGL